MSTMVKEPMQDRLIDRLKQLVHGEQPLESPKQQCVMPATPEERLEALVLKWNLKEYYSIKSAAHEAGETAKISQGRLSYEHVYQEVPPDIIIRTFLTDRLVQYLLQSNFRLRYSNGAPDNQFDTARNLATVKYTDDALHEIGHGLWYNLIPADEALQKQAFKESMMNDWRAPITPEMIPTLHKKFAKIVGAFSGQFLVDPSSKTEDEGRSVALGKEWNYRNELEEHFARTFDRLLKGKPLYALPTATSSTYNFLRLFKKMGVIDDEFQRFYKASIASYRRGLQKVPMEQMPIGDPIDTPLIRRTQQIKEKFCRR